MVQVSVVGGGTAGFEAARGAEAHGAKVTVFDKREEPHPPWDSWLDQINPSGNESAVPSHCRRSFEFSAVKGDVVSVSAGQITTHGGKFLSDAIIMATGSTFCPITFVGKNKPGVIVLDAPGAYAEVGRIAASTDRIVICGEGERALHVSDRLATGHIDSKVAITRWKGGCPSPAIIDVIASAARREGVVFFNGTVRRALGVGRLEAVELDGEVMVCSTLVVLPVRRPSVPPTEAMRGPRGGLLVDRGLRSSLPSLFGAGACAEADGWLPLYSSLEEEAATSGRVAGGNAAGGDRKIQPFPLKEDVFFDLRWSRAGVRFPRGGSPLLGCASQTWGHSGCTLVYQKRTRRVVGIETVDHIKEKGGEIAALITEGKTLDSLAHGGSTDISLISETARIGLQPWSRS